MFIFSNSHVLQLQFDLMDLAIYTKLPVQMTVISIAYLTTLMIQKKVQTSLPSKLDAFKKLHDRYIQYGLEDRNM